MRLKAQQKRRRGLPPLPPHSKLLVIIASSCVLWSACTNPTSDSNIVVQTGKRVASADVVRVRPDRVSIAAGESAEAIVRLEIQNGYHLNANPATERYLIPTEMEIKASEGIAVRFVIYPDAVKKTFGFAQQPLAVYEGEAVLKIALRADSSATKGGRHLSGKLRIQACDDEVCYPPATIDVSIPVTVT